MQEIPFCPNCDHPLDRVSNFCGNCGQKNGAFDSNFWAFFREFISTTFNFENKFFRTVIKLFNPAQLTIEFFNGVRKKYYHPFRIYFVSIILLFFSIRIVSIIQVSNPLSDPQEEKVSSEAKRPSNFESQNLEEDVVIMKIGKRVTADGGRNRVSIQKRHLIDSYEESKYLVKDSNSLSLIDSIFASLYLKYGTDKLYISDTSEFIPTEHHLITQIVTLSFEDKFFTELDTVVRSKNLKHWVDKIALIIIIQNHREGYTQAIFGNLTWFLLAIVPLLALILKLFYSKKRSYFLEHYVFLLELFSALIIINIGFLFLNTLFNKIAFFLLVALISNYLFTLLSFKKYYQQGWILTFIKLLAIGFVSFLMVVISTFTFAIVTAFFY